MDTVDITPTPEACRQIARLFTAQRADAEALAARAAQALAHLDEHPDGHLAPWGRGAVGPWGRGAVGPWGRDLLTVAFAALYKAEGTRVSKMREGLEALGPYADNGKGSDDAP